MTMESNIQKGGNSWGSYSIHTLLCLSKLATALQGELALAVICHTEFIVYTLLKKDDPQYSIIVLCR